ncbi:hypothetical protein [Paraburkholderia adhaesiva]|uniref:hypothetical protein n=1 Tax=Paraburkholderia adhaesiva TaxID=2883244 RepID=UPI001F466486|nr:hypothetical protein [Paraburkholderia adhaesiva]
MLKHVAIGVLLVSMAASVSVSANAQETRFKTATEALSCIAATDANPGTCPYPNELMRSDPAFRRAFNATVNRDKIEFIIRHEQQEVPVTPVSISGRPYISGYMNQRYESNFLLYIYQPSQDRVAGAYGSNAPSVPDTQIRWVGAPSEDEKRWLKGRIAKGW